MKLHSINHQIIVSSWAFNWDGCDGISESTVTYKHIHSCMAVSSFMNEWMCISESLNNSIYILHHIELRTLTRRNTLIARTCSSVNCQMFIFARTKWYLQSSHAPINEMNGLVLATADHFCVKSINSPEKQKHSKWGRKREDEIEKEIQRQRQTKWHKSLQTDEKFKTT